MLGRAGKTGFAQESDRHPVLRGSVVSGSAIGYITPNGMLAGRQQEIHAERDRKWEATRQQRRIRRRVKNDAQESRVSGLVVCFIVGVCQRHSARFWRLSTPPSSQSGVHNSEGQFK